MIIFPLEIYKYYNNSKKYFLKTLWAYFKYIFNINDNSEFNSIYFKIIKIIIFFLNYLLITALLFTDNYISLEIKIIKNELESVLTKEILRIISVFVITQFLNEIISSFFNEKEKLEEIDKNFLNGITIKEYFGQIDFLKMCFKIKFIIGFIFILILHIIIIYYFIIFTCIYSNNHYQFYLFIYFILTICLYFFLYFALFLLTTTIRLISLKFEKSFIFKLLTYLDDLH